MNGTTIHAVRMPRGEVTQTRDFVYTPTTYAALVLPALWLTSVTNPENGTVSYTYNADGSVASKNFADRGSVTYTYDQYGRLTAGPNGSYTYDTCPANDTFCTGTPGQLVEAMFGSNVGPNALKFQYNYTYTPAGRVTSKTLTVQSDNYENMGGQLAFGSLTASYAYDNQGALTSVVYPPYWNWANSAIQTFNYTLDALRRPTGLQDTWSDSRTPTVNISGVSYNAANQTSYGGRTYNQLLQVTHVGSMTYNYSPSNNNGQIVSSGDAVTGETITYQYDALKRLASASSNQNWGEQYHYDGFGNLTQMQPSGTAGAPSLSVAVDSSTNRIMPSGISYDSRGNVFMDPLWPGAVLSWDNQGRLTEVQAMQNSYYGYDSDGNRYYYRDASGNETIYFYGADGKRLATYTYQVINYLGNQEIQLTQQSQRAYFAGMPASWEEDRLGSATSNSTGNHRYYPYGAEYTASANDTEKYATYTRDTLTGLDYAVNRYYSSIWGRFMSPDPYVNSGGLGDPGSWNRYAYAGGDPINRADPGGTCWIEVPYNDPISVPCSLDLFGSPGESAKRFRANPDPPDRNGIELPTLPDCDGLMSATISDFLTSHKSPLLAQDKTFIADVMSEARQVNVDPRLFVAETAESGWGSSSVATTKNNPFGLKYNGQNLSYDDVGGAVLAEGVTLKKFAYDWGETVSQMYSGLPGLTDHRGWKWIRPPAYCQGEGCQALGQVISDALKAMGGDPDHLGYPSGQVGSAKCK